MKQINHTDYFQIFFPGVSFEDAIKVKDSFIRSIENPVEWSKEGMTVKVTLSNATPIYNMIKDTLELW